MNDELRTKVCDALTAAIGEDAYDCTRAWSAWGYGTMSADDFEPIIHDADRLQGIADAVLAVMQPAAELERELVQMRQKIDRLREREAELQQELQTTADALGHAHREIEQLASRGGVPEGWRLVPVEPTPQSPPDDPLGGLEHRADGESNFYTLSRPTGNWVARIQFNGELHTHEQERILNAMLGDRNVRYGDGYHQGYWDARQDSPDVSALVEALELAAKTLILADLEGEVTRRIDAALAAQQQEGRGDE